MGTPQLALVTIATSPQVDAGFRRRELSEAYGHVRGRVRRVPREPFVTLYDLAWHMNLYTPDITPEELDEVWELDGCDFTWLDNRNAKKWRLVDAARVLRKARAQQNTLRLGAYQRSRGRDSERTLWLTVKPLGRPVTLKEAAQLTSASKSATTKRFQRLEKAGYARKDGALWALLGDTAPGREPIRIDLHIHRAIRQGHTKPFPITPGASYGLSLEGSRS